MTDDAGLHYTATHDTLTIWWDRPDDARSGRRYQVTVSDDVAPQTHQTQRIQQTTVTHCTIGDLQPSHPYHVTVHLVDADDDRELRELGGVDACTTAVKRMLDVTRPPYRAVGDGRTLNTTAIQRALDDCDADTAVLIPAGTFLTGALRMHSHTELVVAAGATLQGTTDPADYEPYIRSRFEGIEMDCLSSLINIGELDHDGPANCTDVTIRGAGAILSGGRELMRSVIDREKQRIRAGQSTAPAAVGRPDGDDTVPGRVRPRLINMSNASRVTIAGLTLGQSASWNVHMIYSDHIVTYGCTFRSKGVFNGDGWDPDSCEDCTIFGCVFETGDDAIAIKSGKNPEGNRIGRPSRRIRIFDCRAEFGFGITLGSEMSGGIDDVRIWDCDMSRTSFGLEIKATRKRGGYVRDVVATDSTFSHIQLHGVPYNDDGEDSGQVPVFERMRFERVRLLDRFPATGDRRGKGRDIEVCGFDADHPVRGIVFRELTFSPTQPGAIDPHANGAANIRLRHVRDVSFDVDCA
ncbi:polygalacturonase [Bifidobacterium ramosum]|uniref:Glycoside hydrolase family 28 protein n=1 Tax=Bifidobacterium ramosum TaxID=1798158 RepID=A0A6L4WZA9_9BIFI|nr:glycosyl hydrolase family 28 protein [Bifidobacterium ramosum]KAB8287689.1 polygalacturonase [Bifidobacterium ramosum]NEG72281.1 glycoside hydrolase family 28 protein [Bifidobacterium ramosum]